MDSAVDQELRVRHFAQQRRDRPRPYSLRAGRLRAIEVEDLVFALVGEPISQKTSECLDAHCVFRPLIRDLARGVAVVEISNHRPRTLALGGEQAVSRVRALRLKTGKIANASINLTNGGARLISFHLNESEQRLASLCLSSLESSVPSRSGFAALKRFSTAARYSLLSMSHLGRDRHR